MTGVGEIRRIIPHRYPILLVDRVSDVVPGERLTAHKAVTAAEPCYELIEDDAPPEAYAYPISLLIESWAQAAVLLVCWQRPNPNVLAGKVELASGMRKVDLVEPVWPGDRLDHHVEIVRTVDDAAIIAGHSTVEGRTVLRVGQFVAAMRDFEVLVRVPATGGG
jgi:3-hydroxyacyl-[acyl-carrier-protein] dehydratase